MIQGGLWASCLFLISRGILSSSNTGETGKPELKPFLTILGTRMRAKKHLSFNFQYTLSESLEMD